MHSDHDPEALLLGQVDARLASRRAFPKPPHRDFRARMPLSAVPAIIRAARERDMSVSAYIRRAGLAFAAYDLGLDLKELLEDEPATRLKYEGVPHDRLEHGQGHGNWIIGSLWP